MVNTLKACFVHITFEKIPREKNRAIDAMATLASLFQLLEQHEWYEFLVEEVVQPIFIQPDSLIICHLYAPNPLWYNSIITYLCDNTIPSDLSHNQKWNFIQQTSRYTLVADTLYRKILILLYLDVLKTKNLGSLCKNSMQGFVTSMGSHQHKRFSKWAIFGQPWKRILSTMSTLARNVRSMVILFMHQPKSSTSWPHHGLFISGSLI